MYTTKKRLKNHFSNKKIVGPHATDQQASCSKSQVVVEARHCCGQANPVLLGRRQAGPKNCFSSTLAARSFSAQISPVTPHNLRSPSRPLCPPPAALASGTRPGCSARGRPGELPRPNHILLGFIGFHWVSLGRTREHRPGRRPARPLPGAQGGAAADERPRHPPRPCPGPSERHSLLYCEILPLIWSGGISLVAIQVYWALSGPVAFAILPPFKRV